MTITISEVQEVIKNLESGGEISIKEEKYLNVAKLCMQLAAENVALKAAIAEEIEVINRGGQRYCVKDGISINPIYARGWNDHRANVTAVQTPATDAFLAGIKADGVEMFVEKCREKSMQAISSDIRNNWWLAGEHAEDFAAQLRERADK